MIKRQRGEMGLSIILAIQASIMFGVAPLTAAGVLGQLTGDVFRLALATAAVLLVTRTWPTAMLICGTLLVSLLLPSILWTGRAATASDLLRLGVTTTFDIAVASVVARVALGPGRVTVHRIMGGVILYLSIGIVFANFYRAAALNLHPAFAGLPGNRRAALGELLYFSLSTLTTTGFGDVTPVHPFVRSLANLEAVMGQLFPATLLARLVTLHTAGDSGTDGGQA
jgi:hypothetical protein